VSAGWAAVLVAVLVAAGSALAGVMRLLVRGARLEQQLIGLAADVAELARGMREDKRVTDQRIFWLERRVGRGRG
jgi:hypothetical protein